jgi:hypothetical protein
MNCVSEYQNAGSVLESSVKGFLHGGMAREGQTSEIKKRGVSQAGTQAGLAIAQLGTEPEALRALGSRL